MALIFEIAQEASLHKNLLIFSWFSVFFILERFSQKFLLSLKKEAALRRWFKNTIFGILNRFLVPLLVLPILIFATQNSFLPKSLLFLSSWEKLIVDILVLDFVSYWFHVLNHKFACLWRFHEIHHLDQNFDVTTGLRIHFIELVIANLFRAIPIMFFGISLASVGIFELILVLEGLFHHSNIKIPFFLNQILNKVIVTPDRHSVHHHAQRADTDSNYGFIFIWWDHLFGSFNKRARTQDWTMGLKDTSDLSLMPLLISPLIPQKIKTSMALNPNYQRVE